MAPPTSPRARLDELDKRLLEKHDLVRKSVAGDGNCQFRAFSYQIYGNQERHGEIRAAAVARIENNFDDYLPFFDGEPEKLEEYVTDMKEPEQWGDENTLRAAAHAYGITVRVITPDFDRVYEPPPDWVFGTQAPRKELRIAFANEHYDSTIAKPSPGAFADASASNDETGDAGGCVVEASGAVYTLVVPDTPPNPPVAHDDVSVVYGTPESQIPVRGDDAGRGRLRGDGGDDCTVRAFGLVGPDGVARRDAQDRNASGSRAKKRARKGSRPRESKLARRPTPDARASGAGASGAGATGAGATGAAPAARPTAGDAMEIDDSAVGSEDDSDAVPDSYASDSEAALDEDDESNLTATSPALGEDMDVDDGNPSGDGGAEYERKRDANVTRNKERMWALGLGNLASKIRPDSVSRACSGSRLAVSRRAAKPTTATRSSERIARKCQTREGGEYYRNGGVFRLDWRAEDIARLLELSKDAFVDDPTSASMAAKLLDVLKNEDDVVIMLGDNHADEGEDEDVDEDVHDADSEDDADPEAASQEEDAVPEAASQEEDAAPEAASQEDDADETKKKKKKKKIDLFMNDISIYVYVYIYI